MSESPPQRPVRVLFLAGLSGAGKMALAHQIYWRYMPNHFGSRWAVVPSPCFHTPRAQSRIKRGVPIRSASEWSGWTGRFAGALYGWQLADDLIILPGSLPNPGIRRRVIDLGQPVGPEALPNHWVLWLDVAPETARRRLQADFEKTGDEGRHPRVFDAHEALCEPPRLLSDAPPLGILLPTDERQVYRVDAETDDFAGLALRIITSAAALHKYCVR